MLYEVIVENTTGVNGIVTSSSGLHFEISSPLNAQNGTNPEELIASSWATCLNATIQALLKSRGYEDVQSRVRVRVTLEKETIGYYFTMHAFAAIQLEDDSTIQSLVESAHHRCPVSKLIRQNEHVTVSVEPF